MGQQEKFGLPPGRSLGGKYVVNKLLGRGWEGEVYHVTEVATGIERAAKLFYPGRNPGNKALTFYARKLDQLRDCPILIQYHTQDTFVHKGKRLPFLISEYVRGDLFPVFLKAQRGGRLHPFEALHILHALMCGLEEIHARGEYHGDIHMENIIIRRQGIGFRVKLIDMYHWGRRTREHVEHDLCCAVRVLYDAVGGAQRYRGQPEVIKRICCGLKRTLICKRYRDASQLRRHLESMDWQ